MKQWKQMIMASSLFIVYLMAGAFLFRALELPNNIHKAKEFLADIDAFLETHPNLSKEEFYEYSLKVVEAVKIGVLGIDSRGHVVEGDSDDNINNSKTSWDLPNAFFFSATVVTTIGYGHLSPQTSMGRVACMFYATIGLPLTGWVIGILAHSLTISWTKTFVKSDSVLKACLSTNKLRKVVIIIFTTTLLYTLLLHLPALAIDFLENWNTLTSLYFCFITMTTIGFGDLVIGQDPDISTLYRWCINSATIVYVMLGLSILVALSSSITGIARKQVKKTIAPGNTYRLTLSTKNGHMMDRKRSIRNSVMANEVALFKNSPNLSSATLTSMLPPDDELLPTIMEEGAGEIERRSLSNQHEDIDLPQSTSPSPSSSSTTVDISILSTSREQQGKLDRENTDERNRNSISFISLNDSGCEHVNNQTHINHR